jgi:hypothetical protein
LVPDRDPPIEPEDELSEFAKELGDALDQDTPSEAPDASTTPGPSEGDTPYVTPRLGGFSGGTPYDPGASEGPRSGVSFPSKLGGPGGWNRRFRSRLRIGGPSGCATAAAGVALLVLVILLIVYVLSDLGGDDTADLVGGSTGTAASPTTEGTAGATSEATAAPTTDAEPEIVQVGEAYIDLILEELYLETDLEIDELEFIEDQLLDFLDSISGRTPTFIGPTIDVRRSLAFRVEFSSAGMMEAYGNTIYECGSNDGQRAVVCPSNVLPMPEEGGAVWAFAMLLAEPVPLAAADRSYIYSAVFDSDGDPANDWRFNPPFDFDLFQAADRWYQLAWDHNGQQWILGVNQVNAAQQPAPVPSAVRAVIEGDTIVFFIPAAEFALAEPPYRLTAFGHDGTFNENDRGADVTGVDPTAPLTVPPTATYTGMPEAR